MSVVGYVNLMVNMPKYLKKKLFNLDRVLGSNYLLNVIRRIQELTAPEMSLTKILV